MAQNITLLGASYSDVPSILLPKTGGGQASFTDVTDTTATASDVASGKYFYAADGTRTLGTSSGGGGGEIKVGALRPDAELVEKWTMDQYAVADLGLTIPSYKTSSTTLKASANIDTYTGDPLNYRYYITERTLTIPEYSITTIAKGRQEYTLSSAQYEWLYSPSGQMSAIIDPSKAYGANSQIQAATMVRLIYWNSATAVSVYSSAGMGAYQSMTAPTIGSHKTITIKSPSIAIGGHSSMLAQTFYDAITDIRYQYVIELWRVPLTGIDGWSLGTQMDSIFTNIANGGTLT